MATKAITQNLTYEQYLKAPEVEGRYDIVDGEMRMASAPVPGHQITNAQFFRVLDAPIRDLGLGWLLYAPVDVVIEREPLRTRQPDLLLMSNERFAQINRFAPIEEAPDLVIEILSPSNSRRDIADKIDDYARIGVSECWLASTEAHTIEVLTLVSSDWQRRALLGGDDKMRSNILQEVDVEVSQFFV